MRKPICENFRGLPSLTYYHHKFPKPLLSVASSGVEGTPETTNGSTAAIESQIKSKCTSGESFLKF